MNTNQNKYNLKGLGLLVLCFIYSSMIYAQTINGARTTNTGQANNYSLSGFTGFGYHFIWNTDGIISASNGNTHSGDDLDAVSITWSTPGTKIVDVEFEDESGDDYYYTTINVTVNGSSAPDTPSNPTVQSMNCGNTVLLRGSPPNGVDATWHWQSSPNGTSTSALSSALTYTRTGGTIYYLRAKNSQGVWSAAASSVTYTVEQPTIWYEDIDGDGAGDPGSTKSDCVQPVGYVSNASDLCPTEFGVNNGCPTVTGTGNQNYIRTTQPQIATTDITVLAEEDMIESIVYSDGLGRAKQSIAIRAGGNSDDMVTVIEYDHAGRIVKEYLPYATTSNGGGYRVNGLDATNSFYDAPRYEDDFPGMSAATINPYSEKAFEASPLNRVLKQAAPGNDWAMGQGHEIEMAYQTNISNEVRFFDVNTTIADNTYQPQLLEEGYYSEGELYKNTTYDENHTSGKNHSTEEFTNKQGQVVLKRTYADVNGSETPHDTYYVYDDFGNLTYVLPPKVNVTNGVSAAELTELSYQYTYDHRNRLVIKQIPGKEKEYIVYNTLDQPILTQDANQRAKNEWLFTKYDAFGRVAYTGMLTTNIVKDRVTVQNEVNALNGDLWVTKGSYNNGGIDIGYTNAAYPTAGTLTVFTVNYYDDYNFNRGNEPTVPATIFGETIDARVKGIATGSRVRVLETNDWITTISRYNYQGHVIYSYSENEYLNTTDLVTTKIDFVGRPLTVRAAHSRAGTTVTTLDNFTYDHIGRLLTQTQCIGNESLGNTCPNGGTTVNAVAHLEIADQTVSTNQVARERIIIKPTTTISSSTTLRTDPNATISGGEQELIVSNSYDEIGQLINKKVGGATTGNGLQNVAYDYNVRGWLTDMNDVANTNKLFNFKIDYNQGSNPLYNGNISKTSWRSANDDSSLKSYEYSYDPLNRITSAIDDTNDHRYSLINVEYDKNGNIQKLKRNGHTNNGATSFGIMDDLTYSYTGNQLKAVDDDIASNATQGFVDGTELTTEYTYDDNGNMTSDANKGITAIEYNHLNLPTKVTINGNGNNGTISYIYDATGVKLEKQVSTGTNTEYCGNYIYENGTLQFFSHPEGYVDASGSGYNYVYQCKDHLGNVRLSYTEDPSNLGTPTIIEESNYYPFGLKHNGYNSGGDTALGNDVAQRWKFGGKEYQEEFNLDWYDVTARNYDPALGRWMNLDPLSEEMRRHSPYNYAFDNPIFFTDPDGMMPIGSQGPCGDKPCPDPKDFSSRMKKGADKFKKGVKDFINSITGDALQTEMAIGKSNDPVEQETLKSENEQKRITAIGDMGEGGEDALKGGIGNAADIVDDAAEKTAIAAHTVTVVTGGATAPVTGPIAEGAAIVSASSKTVKATIHASDGNYAEAFEEGVGAGITFATAGTGKRVVKQIQKSSGTKLTKKQKSVHKSSTVLFLKAMWNSVKMSL